MTTWTTVPDAATGDVLTEAMWDTYIRDNMSALGGALIAMTVLGAAASSVDFQGITQVFKHLRVVGYARGDTAATYVEARMRFNNDSTAIYDNQAHGGNATGVVGFNALNSTSAIVGYPSAANAPANAWGSFATTIVDYSDSTKRPLWVGDANSKRGTTTTLYWHYQLGGCYQLQAAISRVTILAGAGNFVAGSTFAVYGLGG